MKIRNSGGPTLLGGVAGPAPVKKVEATKPAREITGSSDVATVMGIPETELTPKVREAIAELMAEVHMLREELERTKKRVGFLEQLADQDTLAPVLNRRAFVRELTRMTAFAERYGATGSVIYFDVNGMKQVNDSLGHSAGDAALRHVAEVLMRSVRASDIVGRLGGDEFGVILAQSGGDAATSKAASLVEAIHNEPVEWNGHQIRLRVAYGVHVLLAGDEVDAALDAADRAMYAQKRESEADSDPAPKSEQLAGDKQ